MQARAVGGVRSSGNKVLEAGYSCDPDFDIPGHLVSWGLITNAQSHALSDVHEAVQAVRHGGSKSTLAAMSEDPAWQKLRITAQRCLRAFGKQLRAAKLRVD